MNHSRLVLVRSVLAGVALAGCIVTTPGGRTMYGGASAAPPPTNVTRTATGDPNANVATVTRADPNANVAAATQSDPSSAPHHARSPNLVGMTLDQARAAARAAGITGEIVAAEIGGCFDPAPVGEINCQMPPPNNPVDSDDPMKVNVVRPERREVPDAPAPGSIQMHALIGLSRSAAEGKLHELGFHHVRVGGLDGTEANAGDFDFGVARVCETLPGQSFTINPRSDGERTIQLYYCPRRDQRTRISLIGLDETDARVLAMQVGFTGAVGTRKSEEPIAGCAEDRVCRTEPANWQGARGDLILVFNK